MFRFAPHENSHCTHLTSLKKLSLGLYRSDYMVHQDLEDSQASPTIKQVEFNTIAASFGGLSSKTSDLHKYSSSSPCVRKHTNYSVGISQIQDIKVFSLARLWYHPTSQRTLLLVGLPPVCVLHMMLTARLHRHTQHVSSS